MLPCKPLLCTDPLLVLAPIIIILDTMAANENAAEADWQKTAESMCYLAEYLAAITSLVDSSTPSMNNAFTLNVILRGESSCKCGPLHTLFLDIARGLACPILLTKLVELDSNVWPYLAVLMVSALTQWHKMLTIPDTLQL